MDRAVPEFPSEFILCIDKVKKRRCSIRIWVLIINDSFKKSSRAFTGLGPSEEPGELIVENVPLKWVLKIHSLNQFDLHNEISEWILIVNWKSQFDFFENFKLSSDEFSQSGFSEECGVFPDIWIKNGSSTLLTFIVTKNLNSYNLKNHPLNALLLTEGEDPEESSPLCSFTSGCPICILPWKIFGVYLDYLLDLLVHYSLAVTKLPVPNENDRLTKNQDSQT